MTEGTIDYVAGSVTPLSAGMMAGTALYTLLPVCMCNTMMLVGSAFLIALLAGRG